MNIRQLIKPKGNKVIWTAVVVLMIASFLAVYSSTSVLAYQKMGGNTSFYMLKHLGMLLMGFGTIFLFHRISIRYINGLSTPMLLFSIGLLVLALVGGQSINNSSRWISVGGFSIQPSEFAKVTMVIYVAMQLGKKEHIDNPGRAFWHIIVPLAVVCGLILIENLSTAGLVGGSCFVMMFVGRVPWRYLLSTAAVGIGFLVLVFLFAPYLPLPRAQTWHNRIVRHFTASEETENSDENYQIQQALMAVSTGGFIGRGPGNSYMKNFLPMAFSDFIFAIILEEYGMWGGIVILLCYWALMMQCLSIMRACRRAFQLYLVMGLGLLISLQVCINVAVCLGIMPVTGQTLPMVSMGGSSNLFIGMAIGLTLSVSREVQEQQQEEEAEARAGAEAEMVE